MAYKIPNLSLRPASDSASSVKNLTEGLPITKIESIVFVNSIGRGGFGQVSLYKKNGELLVLKEMLDESERCQHLFLKEARILNMLRHKNIVRFHSLCQKREEPINSFLLEYVQFVFDPFGQHKSVSSLQDFLIFIDKFKFKDFEHLQNFLARDICAGLEYLHERNIAHRDLKPGNVLISNQHYSSLSGQEFEMMWMTQPVIAKLTDFGESRAALVQTNNVLHTHTKNIYRGTELYMAPEILKHDGISEIRLEELKNMDIWSYAMVLFVLLNPDLRYPYELDLDGSKGRVPKILLRLFDMQQLPCDSPKYDSERKSHWGVILEAYRFCAKFTSRPTAREVLSLIESLLDKRNPVHQEEQIYATLYGQCIGDAIGLLTEFMSKDRARHYYGKKIQLEYTDKIVDRHRECWKVADWTDDSDHMILIMMSLIDNDGVVNPRDFARRLVRWMKEGFHELGDIGGIGIDHTTCITISRKGFEANPHKISKDVWEDSGRFLASNGGVMRTAILGIHNWWDTNQVYRNAIDICKTTHFDPRCQASAVSVCIAISLMLQRKERHYKNGEYIIPKIIEDVFNEASTCFKNDEEKRELLAYLECVNLPRLCLDEENSKDFNTYKCLGAGFWALKQSDFRDALQEIALSGGDSDANCAVAGALLGCKLGSRMCIPRSWLQLKHGEWLNMLIQRYLKVLDTLRRNEIV